MRAGDEEEFAWSSLKSLEGQNFIDSAITGADHFNMNNDSIERSTQSTMARCRAPKKTITCSAKESHSMGGQRLFIWLPVNKTVERRS
jgi:hypothetical protein